MRLQTKPGLRHCFVALPPAFTSKLREDAAATAGTVVLELRWEAPQGGDCRAYVCWNGATTTGGGTAGLLEMDEAFAHCLGLGPALAAAAGHVHVRVQRVDMVEFPTRLELEPCTPDDWDLVELHAGYLEGELLRQVAVVYAGQTLPIWIHGHKLIRLRVINLASRAPQRLSTRTEVAVAPRLRPKPTPPPQSEDGEGPTMYPASPPLRVQPLPAHKDDRPSLAQTAVLVHPATFHGACGFRKRRRNGASNAATMQRLQEAQQGDGGGGGGGDGQPPPQQEAMLSTDGNIAALLEEGKLAAIWLDSAPADKDDKNPPSSSSNTPHHPCAVGVVVLSEAVLPGHVMLSKALRLQIGARPFHCVCLRVLSSSLQWPIRAASLTLHPIHWMVPPEATRLSNHPPSHRPDEQEWEEHAFLEGGLGGGVIPKAFRQQPQGNNETSPPLPPVGPDVWVGLQEWIKIESERAGSGDVFLADGAVVLLAVGPERNPRAFMLSIHSAIPSPPSPLYVALVTAPESIQAGPEVPRAWLVDAALTGGGGEAGGPLGGREPQLKECLVHVAPVLDRAVAATRICAGLSPPGGLLVYGQPCSGKTALCRMLATRLGSSARAVATVWLDCMSLRGHKMNVVLEELNQALARARYVAPSLLVLDNLDAVCPVESEDAGDANLQAAEIADHVMELLHAQRETVRRGEAALRQNHGGMLTRKEKKAGGAWAVLEAAAVNGAVALVATAKDPNNLHATLRRSGGLEMMVEVPPLDAKAREAVLAALLAWHSSTSSSSFLDLATFAARLEGCTPSDLELLMTRALHEAVGRTLRGGVDHHAHPPSHHHRPDAPADARPCVLAEDLEAALDGFSAASLRNARLFASDVRWADVGGLQAIKDEVRDVLEVPVKFAPLYARLPARLPTGLLLYGPPGCGKTLLAGAVAKECGLNFISIKGPEVLDKYIGASEQAVRTLFARATAAAPCVLFFDEFDALAPRRGNDNTGVTDRVVNQLLTFLDGVEGRSGVYVMGATSRPDMIDPALLRPGRLDRQLYLGFPDGPERAAILQALGRKMQLAPDAWAALQDVAVAEGAEQLTGADLQALLSTAQLEAVHEKLSTLGKNGGGGGGGSGGGVEVTARHVWSAFESTRPSMPQKERAQFAAIYARFQSAREGKYSVASATDDGTGKHLRTALK